MAVGLDLLALVVFAVVVEELARQVVDQLADLPFLPAVLPLVEVDRVAGAVEQLPDGTSPPVDSPRVAGFAHAGFSSTRHPATACDTAGGWFRAPPSSRRRQSVLSSQIEGTQAHRRPTRSASSSPPLSSTSAPTTRYRRSCAQACCMSSSRPSTPPRWQRPDRPPPRHPAARALTVISVMKLLETSKPTAGRAVDALAAAGVLVETTGKRRDRSWSPQRTCIDRVSGRSSTNVDREVARSEQGRPGAETIDERTRGGELGGDLFATLRIAAAGQPLASAGVCWCHLTGFRGLTTCEGGVRNGPKQTIAPCSHPRIASNSARMGAKRTETD